MLNESNVKSQFHSSAELYSMNYCIVVWAQSTKTVYFESIHKLQKRAVYGKSSRTRTTPLFNEQYVYTLRHAAELICMVARTTINNKRIYRDTRDDRRRRKLNMFDWCNRCSDVLRLVHTLRNRSARTLPHYMGCGSDQGWFSGSFTEVKTRRPRLVYLDGKDPLSNRTGQFQLKYCPSGIEMCTPLLNFVTSYSNALLVTTYYPSLAKYALSSADPSAMQAVQRSSVLRNYISHNHRNWNNEFQLNCNAQQN
jgi:hypothetical protein